MAKATALPWVPVIPNTKTCLDDIVVEDDAFVKGLPHEG
jgi:hypothetical protein